MVEDLRGERVEVPLCNPRQYKLFFVLFLKLIGSTLVCFGVLKMNLM